MIKISMVKDILVLTCYVKFGLKRSLVWANVLGRKRNVIGF